VFTGTSKHTRLSFDTEHAGRQASRILLLQRVESSKIRHSTQQSPTCAMSFKLHTIRDWSAYTTASSSSEVKLQPRASGKCSPEVAPGTNSNICHSQRDANTACGAACAVDMRAADEEEGNASQQLRAGLLSRIQLQSQYPSFLPASAGVC